MNRIWSNSEKQYIKDNAHTMKDTDLMQKLCELTGRSISLQALRKQRRKLGIIKCQGRGKCEIVGEKQKSDAENEESSPVPPNQPSS